MSDCPSADQLGQLLAEELSPQEHAVVAAHVDRCPRCQQILETLTDTVLVPAAVHEEQQAEQPGPPFLHRLMAAPLVDGDSQPAAWPAVPGYEIVRLLGRGGMGVVYQARHVRLHRLVALKTLAAAQDDPVQEARFQREAETAARLQHPNIAQVYEVGEHEGRPYFVLEFLGGGSLSDKLSGTPQPPGRAAELVLTLAHAMHYAHQQGVVHRDLKPANVLLAEDGTPKITDFGLAKNLDLDHEQTRSGAVVGTPSYMAPEQAAGSTRQVGPAADIYALGAILYELLTGHPPFKGATVLETLEQVRSEEPVPPRRLQNKVPRDLETVCLTCLRKEPAKRYASAEELARDLERFLAGEPIEARPVGQVERLVRWAARRPALAAVYGLLPLVAVLVAAGGSAAWQWQRAEEANQDAAQARDEAVKAREELAFRTYLHRVNLAHWEWRDNEVARADRLLQQCPEHLRQWEWHYVKRLCHPELRICQGHTQPVLGVCFSPDSKRLASASKDGTVRVWDAATGQEILTLKGHTGFVTGVCFSPDGKRLASASGAFYWGNDPAGRGQPSEVKVWDAATGREALTIKVHTGGTSGVAFSPDGKRLASASAIRTVTVWDAATGQEVLTLGGHAGKFINGVAFSPDGSRLACASGPTVKVWDAQTGQEVLTLSGHKHIVWHVCFSPDGSRLASAAGNKWNVHEPGELKVWDARTGQEQFTLPGHTDNVWSVCFSPDGSHLVSASRDRMIKVWDMATGREAFTLKGHTGEVRDMAFSPDGLYLASASADGTVRLWDPSSGQDPATLKGPAGNVRAAAFTPNGLRIATVSADKTVKVWDAQTGGVICTLQHGASGPSGMHFSPDGKHLASYFSGGYRSIKDRTYLPATVKVWDAQTGQEVFASKGFTSMAMAVCLSPDGQRMACAVDKKVRVWDVQTGQEVLTLDCLIHTTFLGNGAIGPEGRAGFVSALAFSPDGKKLVAASRDDGTVRVWDAQTGQPLLTLKGHTGLVHGVAFSPDGRRLASASSDQTVRVWDAAMGQEVLLIKLDSFPVGRVCFSPDGKRLAVSVEQAVKVWDAATGYEALSLRGLYGGAVVSFSPDGKRLIGLCGGEVKVWDATPSHTGAVSARDAD